MNAQNIAGVTNVQKIENFHSKNKNTLNCVSSQEAKWTILTKTTLQNISIDPITKALPLESPQETSQTKNQFQSLMQEHFLCVNCFVPIAISQAVKSREYQTMGHVGDYEESYKVSMILMSLTHAQKINLSFT